MKISLQYKNSLRVEIDSDLGGGMVETVIKSRDGIPYTLGFRSIEDARALFSQISAALSMISDNEK